MRTDLRDKFAMTALQGFIAEVGFKRVGVHGEEVHGHINGAISFVPDYHRLAELSYKMADAMLEFREENNAKR